LDNSGSTRADSGVSSNRGGNKANVADDWRNHNGGGYNDWGGGWLGDWHGQSARAVGDGEGLRLGGSVGFAVTWDNGGSLWAEGGDGGNDLGGNSGIVVDSARKLVECVGGGDKAKDGEDLNRLHYCGGKYY